MGFQVIGESLNVIGTVIGKAMKERDPKPIQEEALFQKSKGVDWIDINLGPAKKDGHELMPWIVEVVQEVVDDIPVVLDSSNIDAIAAALPKCKLPPMINSIMVRPERYEKMIPLAAEHKAHFCALMWGPDGLPRDENERAALLVEIMHVANEAGIPNERIWVDGIVTPVNIQQPQAVALLNFQAMLQDICPGARSTCGVSNISNGMPDELRHVMNITFTTMLMINGMESFIADAKDDITMDLARDKRPDIVDAVKATMEGNAPDLAGLAEDVANYVKSTKVVLGETLFSDSWLEV
ncbi:MAG: dihydropteroate synthase [Deltaproteobacteria bacterium]|nr:dihydropteroate synthase [Deltaproteobacteria bacterium]